MAERSYALSRFEIHHIWPNQVYERFGKDVLAPLGIGYRMAGNRVAPSCDPGTVAKLSGAPEAIRPAGSRRRRSGPLHRARPPE